MKPMRLLQGLLIAALPNLVLAKPVVIAHRGASGYLPEHTLAAAVLAHAQGADYIEQDLVLTKDRKFVVLHDIHLERVTDVEERFPDMQRSDGRFYAIDFTLEELKQLRVHERHNAGGSRVFPNRYQGQGSYQISTFAEQVEVIRQLNRQLGQDVGVYPELKSPAWHKAQGADISLLFITELERLGLNHRTANIYVQCFDFSETKRLRRELGLKTKLIQLIGENRWRESVTDYEFLKTEQGLMEIAQVADGIGPWMSQLIISEAGRLTASDLSNRAAKAGLAVHPYTHRNDQLPFGLSNEVLLAFLFEQVSIDGLFSDFPDTVAAHLGKKP